MRLAFRVLDADHDLVTAAGNAGDAAAVLRRLLDAVEAGELEAEGPLGVRVVRQLHGAAIALEIADRATRQREPPATDGDSSDGG